MPPEDDNSTTPPASGSGQTPPPTPPPATPPAPGTPPAGGFVSQEEVTRIAAREKDQGQRAGRRSLLTELAQAVGMDPEKVKPEDIAGLLKSQKEAEDARLTEVERKERDLAAREAALAQQQQAAATAQRDARLTAALVRAGVDSTPRQDGSTVLDDARTLLAAVPNDADDKAVAEAVASLRERLPALFASQTPPPPPGGAFTGTPPRPQPNGDAYTRGIERARAMGLAPTPQS